MKHLFPINHFNILPDSKNLHFWYWGGFPYHVDIIKVVPLTFLLFFLKRNVLGLPRRFSLHIGESNITNHFCKYYIVQPINILDMYPLTACAIAYSPPHRKPYIVHRIVAVKFYHILRNSHWINIANSVWSRSLEVEVEAHNSSTLSTYLAWTRWHSVWAERTWSVDQQGSTRCVLIRRLLISWSAGRLKTPLVMMSEVRWWNVFIFCILRGYS